jgi:hypothetical protein
MKRIPWQEQEPGHFEVDLVHHCGPSSSGEYVHTIQMIDVATAWSERRAILGRGYMAVTDAFDQILGHLPFQVRELHPDNGSEFFNHHMLRYWHGLKPTPQLSRSRPYRKPVPSEAEGNDNRFVEQKNSTLVRAYLGYDRLDTVAHTLAVNQLYDKMWLYYNFFQPVMRLKEKKLTCLQGQPSRVKRRYDDASTPFDRLCATRAIPREWQEELAALRENTNPRHLRRQIYDLIDQIEALPCATPGVTEDVHQTLAAHPSATGTIESQSDSFEASKPKPPGKEGTSLVTLSFDGKTRQGNVII